MSSKSEKGSASTLSSVKRSSNPKDGEEPVKKKITLSFGKNNLSKKTETVKTSSTGQLSIKLASKPEKTKEIKVVAPSKKAAALFNESSDSEPEEMPMEARMRMKNIGRDTPTSAGPNSFNKGKLGFVDNQKSWELQQQSLLGRIDSKKPQAKE